MTTLQRWPGGHVFRDRGGRLLHLAGCWCWRHPEATKQLARVRGGTPVVLGPTLEELMDAAAAPVVEPVPPVTVRAPAPMTHWREQPAGDRRRSTRGLWAHLWSGR